MNPEHLSFFLLIHLANIYWVTTKHQTLFVEIPFYLGEKIKISAIITKYRIPIPCRLEAGRYDSSLGNYFREYDQRRPDLQQSSWNLRWTWRTWPCEDQEENISGRGHSWPEVGVSLACLKREGHCDWSRVGEQRQGHKEAGETTRHLTAYSLWARVGSQLKGCQGSSVIWWAFYSCPLAAL